MACKGDRRIGDPGGGGEPSGPQRIFQNLYKEFQILPNFPRNFEQKFMKIRKSAFLGGSGAEPPKLANLLKTYSKNQWKPPIFLKSCTNSERISFSTMRILIKCEVPLVV